MTIQLTAEGLRAIFPRAPAQIVENAAAWQRELDRIGVTHTRTRLAYFFANIEHECGGFTIPHLTENINYTAERMAQVWPNRFKSAAAVRTKYGTASGWQRAAFDDIYGNRMGNRPGTHDGSTFIGRGGPQWTGRDGYRQVETRTGLPAILNPQIVSAYEKQPEICAAFWEWKNLNRKADAGDFKGVVRLWNGGTNGMADRLAKFKGNDPIILRLAEVKRVMPVAKDLPGEPPTPAPPKAVIDATTENERKARTAGAVSTGAGAAGEGSKAVTEKPADVAVLSPFVTYTLIGVGVAIVIVAAVLIARKKAAVIANWF